MDMDATQDVLVTGRTFLPTIPLICCSRSHMWRHSVSVRTGDGTMVLGGYSDIHGFRQWILL